MKKYFLFLVLGFLFSCSQKEESIQIDPTDSTKVSLDQNTDSLISEITCPKCGFKKTETMPTDVCLLKYTCTDCRSALEPKERDCCVFCSYGSKKCPSKQ